MLYLRHRFNTVEFLYLTVGPVLLTIPSYLTFTISDTTVPINVTLTDESEVEKAVEANFTVHSVVGTDENDPQWLMEANVTKYYMYYRYVVSENVSLIQGRKIRQQQRIVLYLQRPWSEKRQITVSSHRLALLIHYQIRSKYRTHRFYGVPHTSVIQGRRAIG